MNGIQAKLTVYIYADDDQSIDLAVDAICDVELDFVTIVVCGEKREAVQ